jgi:hypothetical protein
MPLADAPAALAEVLSSVLAAGAEAAGVRYTRCDPQGAHVASDSPGL